MNKTISISNRWLRWVHEYAFSLNLTWIIVWFERVHSKGLGGHSLARFVAHLVGSAYQLVSPIGGYTILEQVVWSFGVATITFLVLRLMSGLVLTDVALRTIAGAAAIATFPTATLSLGLAYPDCCAEIDRAGLALETVAVLICGIFFYLRKSWIPGMLMILLLILHFSFWAWATSSYVTVPEIFRDMSAFRNSEYYHPWTRTVGVLGFKAVFRCGSPIFGLIAGLTWISYLRHSPSPKFEGEKLSPTGDSSSLLSSENRKRIV
jgi:hypothetical protein